MFPAIDRWQDLARGNTATAQGLADSAAEEFDRAARSYARTGQGTAAGLDRTYPEAHAAQVPLGQARDPDRTRRMQDWKDASEDPRQLLGGDWRKLYREAMLFDDAGGAFRVVYANVFNGRIGIEQYWRGNAAGGGENWLDGYKNASQQHAEFLTEAGQRILDWARAQAEPDEPAPETE